jgi:nucleoside-diphosphate-sugar epimerase
MVGRGCNRKSLAYVQNLADFILYTIKDKSGIHIYNYADKPDLSVREFVNIIKKELGQPKTDIYIPFLIAYIVGCMADLFSFLLRKEMVLSSARVMKFTMPSTFSRKKGEEFNPHFELKKAIRKTISYEFKKK